MAITTAPRCDIRALVTHLYSDGVKAYGHERLTIFAGLRGKAVRRLRNMPMALAHELAMKLQGRIGTTVSVVGGWGLGRLRFPAGLLIHSIMWVSPRLTYS